MIFQEEEREWRVPGLLYADDLALCAELEEDLKAKIWDVLPRCVGRDV